MKTNIVVSAVRVNGYWYLRVKYDENNCRVRYQQSTGLKIDQSYRKVEQARRRVLAELYEINRMDEQCEKWDISPELRYQPVSEWLKRWLDDCRESIAESTLVRYTAVVRHACQVLFAYGKRAPRHSCCMYGTLMPDRVYLRP